MSKGSKRRPEDDDSFRRNWEKIFGPSKAKHYEDVKMPDGSIGRKVKPIEPEEKMEQKDA